MTSADSLVPNYWRHFDAWSQSMKAWSMVYHQSIVPTPRKPRKWSTYLFSVDWPRIGLLLHHGSPFCASSCDNPPALVVTWIRVFLTPTCNSLWVIDSYTCDCLDLPDFGDAEERRRWCNNMIPRCFVWAVQKWKYNVSFSNLQLFLVSEWSPSERHDVDALLALWYVPNGRVNTNPNGYHWRVNYRWKWCVLLFTGRWGGLCSIDGCIILTRSCHQLALTCVSNWFIAAAAGLKPNGVWLLAIPRHGTMAHKRNRELSTLCCSGHHQSFTHFAN